MSPDYWARHLRETVRFSRGCRAAGDAAPGVLLEVGPRTTLGTLARQQPELANERRRRDLFAGRRGEAMRWRICAWPPVNSGRGASRWIRPGWIVASASAGMLLPTYPFERQRHWVDALPGHRGRRGGARTGNRSRGECRSGDSRGWRSERGLAGILSEIGSLGPASAGVSRWPRCRTRQVRVAGRHRLVRVDGNASTVGDDQCRWRPPGRARALVGKPVPRAGGVPGDRSRRQFLPAGRRFAVGRATDEARRTGHRRSPEPAAPGQGNGGLACAGASADRQPRDGGSRPRDAKQLHTTVRLGGGEAGA